MRQRAAQDCDSRRAEGRRLSDEITAKAHAAAEARRANALRSVNAELARLAHQAQVMAEAETEKVALAMKNAVVEEVLAKAVEFLKQLANSPEFVPVLEALLVEVLQEGGSGLTVLAPPAHGPYCERWLRDHGYASMTVHAVPEMWDGVAVQDPSQTYRVTNTLSSRFTKLEAEARRICMTALFAEEGE